MTDDDSQAGAVLEPPYLTTPALRQRLDLLSHLLEFGHQMVLLQGEVGSGRSRLLATVAEQARPNWRMISTNGALSGTAPALLATLTQALELGELDAGVEDLRARLAEIELGGQLCILTLDDAENLDDGARAMLFSLAYSEHQRGDLRVVMTGDADSDFSERLQATAPEGAVFHVVDLPPLEIEELKILALSALPAAGGEALTDELLDLDQLAAAAGGNPGRMLASLRNAGHKPIHPGERAVAAARAMGGALRGFNVRKYTAVLAAAAFVLVAVAVGLVLASRHSANTQPGSVEISLPTPGDSKTVPVAATDTTSGAAQGQAGPATPATSAAPDPATAQLEAAAPVTAAPPPAETQPAAAQAVASSPAVIDSKLSSDAPPVVVAAPDTAVAATPIADKSNSKSLQETNSKTAAAKPATEPRNPAKHAAKAAVAAKAEASDDKSFYSSAWVKRQKPQAYVVQLFGSRERTAGAQFIRDHGLADKATTIEVTLKGEPWFVVVTGLYTTRAAASSAIHAMPPPLAKQKPWPRTVATLK